ncbi:MAG: IS630 family transposase [Candidatus Micrarchaeaceae archaeon]
MLEEDEPLLRKLAKECDDAEENVRYYALHAISTGDSVTDTAKRFLVERQTIYDWVGKWKEDNRVSNEPRSGRPESLTEKDKETIKGLVDENNPKKYGINMSCFDTKGLQIYFASRGTVVSRETIRLCLHELGAHYVKAVHNYTEANRKEQIEFAKRELERIGSVPEDTAVLFEDEASVGGSFRKGYGWTFDERLEIDAPSHHMGRLNCFGAVNPLTGEEIIMTAKPMTKRQCKKLRRPKAYVFVLFLMKILSHYRDKKQIILYIDNLPLHKASIVQRFLAKHPKIKIIWMPSYSPELNPQEGWWKHLRQKLLNNIYFETRRSLSLSISHFTRLTTPEEVRSVCSLTPLQNLLKG